MEEKTDYHNIRLNALTQNEIQQGWILLFDGNTLNGWRNFKRDTLEGWIVENGNMLALGLGGGYANDIITVDEYENFELSLEWKTSPGGNSGIFFHATEDPAIKAIYEIAPEYQIVDETSWNDNTHPDWQRTASCYAMYPASLNKILLPIGEYNLSKIVVHDIHVEHWLNNEKVIEYDMWTPEWEYQKMAGKWKDYPLYGKEHRGHIGLQDHGKKTWFRNVRIRIH
jgi:hypothetical protein